MLIFAKRTPPIVLSAFNCAILLGCCIVGVAFLSGCSSQDSHVEIDFSRKITVDKPVARESAKPKIRIAIGAMISPKETFSSYQDLMNYLGVKLDKQFEIVQRKTYDEINEMLGGGEVDLAFICSGPYVIGKKTHNLQLVVAPEVNGSHFYNAYLIVNTGSKALTLEDLRGKTFAFTDPDSNTGKLAPTAMLEKMSESPETFFSSTTYTYSHDNSILAVSKGMVDGASVDGLIWDYFNKTNPEITSSTKIIGKSANYGIPPVVAGKSLPYEIRNEIKEALLGMNSDPKGREILKRLMIDRFVEAQDSWYDSIRETMTLKQRK